MRLKRGLHIEELYMNINSSANNYVSNILTQSQNNLLIGSRHGVMTLPDGRICEGSIRNGQLNGRGVITHPNGKTEEGEFANNLLNGEGTITWPKAHNTRTDEWLPAKIHRGQFKDGRLNGEGQIALFDGTTHTGQYENDELNGYGVVAFPNGGRWEGVFKNDILNGPGKMVNCSGITEQEGIFEGHELKFAKKASKMPRLHLHTRSSEILSGCKEKLDIIEE